MARNTTTQAEMARLSRMLNEGEIQPLEGRYAPDVASILAHHVGHPVTDYTAKAFADAHGIELKHRVKKVKQSNAPDPHSNYGVSGNEATAISVLTNALDNLYAKLGELPPDNFTKMVAIFRNQKPEVTNGQQ
jgi:hypothetical protein